MIFLYLINMKGKFRENGFKVNFLIILNNDCLKWWEVFVYGGKVKYCFIFFCSVVFVCLLEVFLE